MSPIFPAVIFKAQQMLQKFEEDAIYAFLVGAMIGAIIGNIAILSGNEGGFQVEVGVGSAIAAASIIYLAGGCLLKECNGINF
ncbi:MAG: L-serine ammonia-lyase, iron-sulfur-dependent, subunit alpha [Promethearchaeota archaeon]